MVKPTRNKAYSLTTALIDVFPFPIFKTSAPTISDVAFEVGQVWVYKNGDTRVAYTYCGQSSTGDGLWQVSSSGAGDLEFLQGDSGGQITPVGEEIVIAGGTNLTTVGSSGTITIDLDDAIELATSVSSPLYTAPTSSDMSITAALGQDITMTLGDDSGNNALFIKNSAADTILLVGTDAFIIASPSISIGEDNQAGIVSFVGGTQAKTLNIAHGTGPHIVSIGNATTGAVSMRSASTVTLTAPSVNVAGNLILTSVGTGLQMNGGAATDFIGQVVLVAGVATILHINLDSATDRIFMQRKTAGLSSAIGQLTYVINTGVNFIITSVRVVSPGTTEIDDISTIEYFIVKQN